MTQEQKDLLLKDLCGRLPYGVIVKDRNGVHELTAGNTEFTDLLYNGKCNIKPYLFPLSSMTEEQRKEYEGIIYKYIELHCERYYDVIDIYDFENLEDFYHKHHLDYRGLIRMDLAIDATGLNLNKN